MIANDWTSAETHQLNIAHLENEADKIKRELRVHLPNSLFLPVPRSDLLEVLTVQDKVANRARDIAGLILGRKLTLPEPIAERFITFLKRNIEAVEQANRVTSELDELLETGFTGSEVSLVEDMIHTIDKIESDSDEMQIKVRRDIYALEQSISPIDAMFLYKVVELTGELADGAQRVGDCLQLLLAR